MMSETQAATDDGIGRDLIAFQQNILIVLSEEPMYGLAIKRQLEDYYESEVNHGRLYPNLDDLVEAGLVEKSELDKRTNQYALTDDGYEAIIDTLGWTISKFVTNDNRAQTMQDLVNRRQ
jgi:DNA-binding PadR family transcriptional regulator